MLGGYSFRIVTGVYRHLTRFTRATIKFMGKTASRARLALILLFLGFFIFSVWLFSHTFGFDPKTQSIRIGSTLWSDFGAHLPMVRSFSMGSNWWRLTHGEAPQSPLFPGEKIRYHFLFYMLSGILERMGVRIDWALNIPSIIGMFLLLGFIYLTVRKIFVSGWVAILSVLFFLFNGSLSFLAFFRSHPVSVSTPGDIFSATRFPSFGPWDGGLVSAFWNLNIYTNQRHLALSYAICLIIIYLLYTHKPETALNQRAWFGIAIGILAGSLLFLNQAAFIIAAVYLFWLFVIHPPARFPALVSGLVIIPLLFLYRNVFAIPSPIPVEAGYLIEKPLTVSKFAVYWWHNLGLHVFLIPFGFIFAPRTAKLLIIPLILLFAVPNIWRLSPDMINNHKLFNFVIIMGASYSAVFLVRLWQARRGILAVFNRLITLILFVFLTVSGVIDFAVIANDNIGGLTDIGGNPDARFFADSTKPEDLVLNSTWFYHPASLAGRDIFSGYAYFTWSYGYDKDEREKQLNSIYGASDPVTACRLLRRYGIDWVELNDSPEGYVRINPLLWYGTFSPFYRNSDSRINVYSTARICSRYE